jgi:hypothetical protein
MYNDDNNEENIHDYIDHNEEQNDEKSLDKVVNTKKDKQKNTIHKRKKQKDYFQLLALFLKKETKKREKIERQKQEWDEINKKLLVFHKTAVQILLLFPEYEIKQQNKNMKDLDVLASNYISCQDERYTLNFISILNFYTKILAHVENLSDAAYYSAEQQMMREKVILHSTIHYSKLKQQYKQLARKCTDLQ